VRLFAHFLCIGRIVPEFTVYGAFRSWTSHAPIGELGLAALLAMLVSGLLDGRNSAFADPFYIGDYGNRSIEFVPAPGAPIQTIATTAGRPWGVAVDANNGFVYWADSGGPTSNITRAKLDGTNQVTVLAISGLPSNPNDIMNLALDTTNNWIYYSEGNTRTIRRIHPDGTGGQIVVTGSLNGPIDMALDVPNNWMYWTQITSSTSELFRSRLDGTGTQQLFGDQGFYYGLAIDPAHGYIYFADQHPNQMAIRRLNIDGSNPVTLIPAGEPSGVDIDVAEGKVYWSRRDTPGVWRSNLDGTNVQQLTVPANLPANSYTIDVAVLSVPEPASLAMGATGIVLLALGRCRTRAG
jgi:DNA-binding beta-propeller fold protein YncE